MSGLEKISVGREEDEICLFRRGLPIIGKLFLELLAGEEDAALHGAEGKFHLFGYLVVLVAGHVHREGMRYSSAKLLMASVISAAV